MYITVGQSLSLKIKTNKNNTYIYVVPVLSELFGYFYLLFYNVYI